AASLAQPHTQLIVPLWYYFRVDMPAPGHSQAHRPRPLTVSNLPKVRVRPAVAWGKPAAGAISPTSRVGVLLLSWLQLIVLAVVQGITEFLPISSSAHLILVPHLTGWPDQGVAIDAASHLGTLAAVLAYFWRDVQKLFVGFVRLIGGRRDSDGRPDRW